jgi:hypothetical protein
MFPTVLSAGSAAPAGDYIIHNSLRFRSSASAYLSRTYASNTTWTLSVWLKRGSLGTIKPILGAAVKFNANDTLTAFGLTTVAVYRDPSAWYHIVVSNSGCYVNGVSVGSVTTSALTNASIGSDGTNYFDGYLTEVNFIDGQALDASAFGELDAITGVWKPKKYTGTYGTNGFYLDFKGGTSTTTLGKDASGNGNNWTTNNISLTAGSTYDWMLDSPTPFDDGGNGVGNYAVLNPLIVQGLAPYNANLTLGATTSYSGKLASIGISSGKWYWEQAIDSLSSNNLNTCQIYGGVAIASSSLNDFYGVTGHWGFTNTNTSASASKSVNNGTPTDGYTIILAGDVVGLALDMDSGSLSVYRNNALLYSVGTSLAGNTVYPVAVTYAAAGNSITSLNFGQRPFAYTPPSGYKALNTQNIPAGTVITSGSFTGNVSTDGPFVWLNGTPTALTINGNAVTFGTHANKLANGFKVISADSRYNHSGSNTYAVTTAGTVFKHAIAQVNP